MNTENFNKLKAEFVKKGTTINRWSVERELSQPTVRKALLNWSLGIVPNTIASLNIIKDVIVFLFNVQIDIREIPQFQEVYQKYRV